MIAFPKLIEKCKIIIDFRYSLEYVIILKILLEFA